MQVVVGIMDLVSGSRSAERILTHADFKGYVDAFTIQTKADDKPVLYDFKWENEGDDDE